MTASTPHKVTRWHAPDVETAIHTPGAPCVGANCPEDHVELETVGTASRQTWACVHSEALVIIDPLTPVISCARGGHHGEPDHWARCPVDPKCRRTLR